MKKWQSRRPGGFVSGARLFCVAVESFSANQLFCDMDVVVDVIGTVAVIAGAFGAVAELKVGIFGIGFAAHSAFVVVSLVFHLFFDCFFIVNGFWRGLMCRPAGGTAQPAQKCFAEKEEEIEQGDNGEQRADEIQLRQGCNDIKGEPRPHPAMPAI